MNTSPKVRTIVFYKNYFNDFFIQQRQKVKNKIIWTFTLIEELKQVPVTYLKHLEGTEGLYEIRVQAGTGTFRVFCFFDHGQLVVVTSGFQKKSKNTNKRIRKSNKN